MNLGVGLLIKQTTVENLMEAISKFDAGDATKVCAHFRKVAGAEHFIEEHLRIYNLAMQTNAQTTADERALATASWIEEVGVSASHRRWLDMAKETGAWHESSEQALLLDLLRSNTKTLNDNRDATLRFGEELSALSSFANEVKRLYNGIIPLFLRKILLRARGRG